MKNLKVSALLYIIIGLLLIIFPGVLNDFFGLAIGALCLVIGVSKIYANSDSNMHNANLTIGILFTMFGIYLFINPKFLTAIIPVVAGVFVIVNAINKISRVMTYGNSTYKTGDIIAAIILFILGVVLLFNPVGSVELLIRIFGGIILINGVYDFIVINEVTSITKSTKKKKKNKVVKTINLDD